MSSWNDFLERNRKYVETSHQPRPYIGEPDNAFPTSFIISCMDPRVPVEEFLNIQPHEAIVVRVAGGRARAALRDIVFFETLTQGGVTKDVIVIHHTDCGCTHTSDDKVQQALKETFPGNEKEIENFYVGAFGAGDLDTLQNTVREDLAFLKEQRLLRQELKDNVKGYVYDIKTGKLSEVV